MTKVITAAAALALFKEFNSTFASFRTMTPQTTLNKGRGANSMLAMTGIDPDKIVKVSSFTALVGTRVDYQTLVQNRQLKAVEGLKAPTFEAEERRWGYRVDGVEVRNDAGTKQYVTLHCVANSRPHVVHLYEGNEINLNDSMFDPWRKEKVEGARQLEAGVINPVIYRDYDLANIVGFTIDKESYQIIG